MTNETWKPIPGHEGLYEVSNFGQVRSLDRTVMKAGKPHSMRGKVLAQMTNGKYGYRKVQLGRANPDYVHRLVLFTFIGPDDGREVDHIDGDTSNNHLTNLRYMTHAENMAARRERTFTCNRGHSFEGNEVWARGRRTCRTCARRRDRERQPRWKALA